MTISTLGLRPALYIAGALTLGACQTLGGGAADNERYTEIMTTPPGATVTIENYGQCESPCRISHDGVRQITIAKAGYRKKTYKVSPGAGKVNIVLELAAPSEDVETTTLPEL